MAPISMLYNTQLEAEALVVDNYWRGFRHGIGFTVAFLLVVGLGGRPSSAFLSGLKPSRIT
jgi:hypothetical protein